MALVTLKEMLRDAQKNRYAIPAFDVSNYEMVRAVAEVCREERSPVLFMGLECDFAGDGRRYIAELCRLASELVDVPVCLHLDHAESQEAIAAALDAGFSSVMFDGSSLPFEENLEKTARIAAYAHARGATVEAELGHVANAIAGTEATNRAVDSEETIENALTRPEQAREFVEKTGVDCLAVAIGTAHGVYVKAPTLRIDRLDRIREATSCPLVLHGGSGTPDDQIRTAIEHGICKINIYSEVLKALNGGLRDTLNGIENLSMWPCFVYQEATRRMREVVREKIRVFGSGRRV